MGHVFFHETNLKPSLIRFFCRHLRDEGDVGDDPHGVGLRAHAGHLGRVPGRRLARLPRPPAPRVLHPRRRHVRLQRPPHR